MAGVVVSHRRRIREWGLRISMKVRSIGCPIFFRELFSPEDLRAEMTQLRRSGPARRCDRRGQCRGRTRGNACLGHPGSRGCLRSRGARGELAQIDAG